MPGPLRDFLHDRSVEIGIFSAVGVGLLEMLIAIQAMEHIDGTRMFFRSAPFWLWAIAPAIVGFLVWLKLHDLPPSAAAQRYMDDQKRSESQFARAERIRRANRR